MIAFLSLFEIKQICVKCHRRETTLVSVFEILMANEATVKVFINLHNYNVKMTILYRRQV